MGGNITNPAAIVVVVYLMVILVMGDGGSV